MKKVVIMILFTSFLMVLPVMDAAATDVVILMCRGNFFQPAPTTVDDNACSKSAGVTVECPTAPDVSCSQVLSNFLSAGLIIRDVQRLAEDGVIYTLIRIRR